MKKDNVVYIQPDAPGHAWEDKYFWSGVAVVLVWTLFSAAATWAVLEWWDL